MKNMTVWSDSLVPLTAIQGDPLSVSATLTMIPPTGSDIEVTSVYTTVGDEIVADLSFTSPSVTEETVYEYYISENFVAEPPLIYPDPENCSDDGCELPTITVCPLGES